MDEEYLILRLEGSVRGRGGLQSTDVLMAAADAASDSKLTLESATMSEAQQRKEARDPDQLVSLVMPVSLISPIAAADAGLAAQGDPIAEASASKFAWGIDAVGVNVASYPYNGKDVVVAVLDTGIDAAHPAFQGVELGATNVRNFTKSGDADGNGHGTHCASTIFGRDVDGVRIGIARGVTNVRIGKVLDDQGRGSTRSLIEGLKWAHSEGANVISMSLGFDFPAMQERLEGMGFQKKLATSRALQAYRDNLRMMETLVNFIRQEGDSNTGAVLVAASGNESRRQEDPRYVIDVSLPAAVDQVVSVGAFMRKDSGYAIAPFSNVNPVLSAPGYGIVGAKNGGGLAALNGTSMACPHVAGLAALWWEREVRDTGVALASTIRSSLVAMASRIGGIGRVDQGSGMAKAPAMPG